MKAEWSDRKSFRVEWNREFIKCMRKRGAWVYLSYELVTTTIDGGEQQTSSRKVNEEEKSF